MTKVDECLKAHGDIVVGMENPTRGTGTQTSTFRETRGNVQHAGLDISMPVGSDVLAAQYGEVWRTREASGYGNVVVIKHSENLFTLYGHLSEVQVKQGECVAPGDLIAMSGNTGGSTGPHLHFEIIEIPKGSGKTINRDKDATLGIKSSDVDIRVDPTFLFTEEHAKMTSVTHREAFRRSGAPAGATALGLGAVVGFFSHGAALFSIVWEGVTSLAAAAIGGLAYHLVVKGSMERQAERRRQEVIAGLNLTVTSENVAAQLAEAERTGRQSPLQRSKIMGQIKTQVADAAARVSALGSKLSDIDHELDDLSRKLTSIESDIRGAATQMDIERAKQRKAEIEDRKEELARERRRIGDETAAAGREVDAAAARASAAVEAMGRQEGGAGAVRPDNGPSRGGLHRDGSDGTSDANAPASNVATPAPPVQDDSNLKVIHLTTEDPGTKAGQDSAVGGIPLKKH